MEIELAAAVAALRDELTEAAARGSGQEITFRVGPIELEFAVELRQDVKAKAGFKAWVVSGDGEAGAAWGRAHRVKVALTPQGPDGDILIRRRRLTGRGPGVVSDRIAD
ncbi:trypco2 family protein [Streptomyces sp. NPDC007905]|uniref:trypco2 family protein n=1 Tax=Streptomyces sp. NPDC007905 TaxID=3364788 RepID=UPI0036EBA4D5